MLMHCRVFKAKDVTHGYFFESDLLEALQKLARVDSCRHDSTVLKDRRGVTFEGHRQIGSS